MRGLQTCRISRWNFTAARAQQQLKSSLHNLSFAAFSRFVVSTFFVHDGSSTFPPNNSAICFIAASHPILSSLHNVSCWLVQRRNCAVHALSSRNFQQRSRSHLSINLRSMRCRYLPIPYRRFIVCKLQELSFSNVLNRWRFSVHPLLP